VSTTDSEVGDTESPSDSTGSADTADISTIDLDDEAMAILRERRVNGEINGENYRECCDLLRNTPISDPAVRLLRMRLAKGETTPNEFREIRNDLAA
jgi:uncharacterized membrane protein